MTIVTLGQCVLKMISEKTRSNIIIVLQRPPIASFLILFNNFCFKCKKKPGYIEGEFNLNLLDYNHNEKLQNYLSLIYQSSFIPAISKSTRITRQTSAILDHINLFVNSNFKTIIFKTAISDYFSICFLHQHLDPNKKKKLHILLKNVINNSAI